MDTSADQRRRADSPALTAAFRWAAIGATVLLVSMTAGGPVATVPTTVFAGVVAVALAAAWPLLHRWAPERGGAVESIVALETAGVAAVVTVTGAFASPYVLLSFVPVLDAGFLAGRRAAVAVPLAMLGATLLGSIVASEDPATTVLRDDAAVALVWGFALTAAGVIAADARRNAEALFRSRRQLDEERRESARRLATVEDANRLLSALHDVAQALPATLDLDGLVATTLDRLQAVFPCRVSAMLALDSTPSGPELRILGARGTAWQVAPLPLASAPTALQLACTRPVAAERVEGSTTLDPTTVSILYAPLMHDGTTIGILALEDDRAGRFTAGDVAVLTGFAAPVAVSLENAELFGRLRTLATSEERARIARELHDRTAQHLAAVAFEVDHLGRLTRRTAAGDGTHTVATVAEGLDTLGREVRKVIEELRESIDDLRTDVTDTKGLADLLREFVPSVASRTGVHVTLELPPQGVRLPQAQERELWRIFQEAFGNVVKHAQATGCRIVYAVDSASAELVVTDDGTGFDPRARKLGHFGVTGMQERATAIGAELSIDSAPGAGSTVRVRVRRPT